MKKLTRKQRLDALKNGFYRYGYLQAENIEDFVLHSTWITEQLTDSLADSVRANNLKLSIDKIRSNDFVDSDGCFYDFRGKTFQYGQFIIHIYPYPQSKDGIANISLLAK